MSLHISSIDVGYIPHGSMKGSPCVRVNTSPEGVEMTTSEVVERIFHLMKADGVLGNTELKYVNGKNVCVQGLLSEMPDLKDLIVGLVGKGKAVYFITGSDQNIEPLRMTKGVHFIIDVDAPKGDQNGINPKIFPILKETDDVIITLTNMDDYKSVRTYLNGRIVTRPTLIFNIRDMSKGDQDAFREAFFFDLRDLNCPTKVTR